MRLCRIDEALIEALEDNTLYIDSADEVTEEWRCECLDTQMMKTELHGIMAQRNRSLNLTRPLYRLPPEILVKILSLALSDAIFYPRTYMKELQTFAFVSHQWRLYVTWTQSFWRVVSSNMPLKLVQRVLPRSTGLLDVVDCYDGNLASLFITHTIEHVHRWRSLTASGRRVAEWYERLVHLSMPTMEALDLRGKSCEALDIGEVGSLRCIRLVGFCIPWESKILSGLQTLKLEALGITGPSAIQLLAILAASSGLIELELIRLQHHNSDSSAMLLQTMRVELLALRTLSIIYTTQELTHHLLAALHIPKCTSFIIDYNQRTITKLSLFNDPMLAHIASSLVASLRLSPIVDWRSERQRITISTPTGTVRLQFDLTITGDQWYPNLPAGLPDALEEAGSDIHLGFLYQVSPSTVLPALLPLQRCITKICMDDHKSHEPADLIRFLTEPIAVDGIMQWPFPRLAELVIMDINIVQGGFVEAISGSIRMNGSGHGSVSVDGGVLEPCTPLHLTINEDSFYGSTSLTQEVVEKLRKVLGDSNLCCIPPP
ncbi:hypothetical protein FRB93_010717 [Tulasnella sp. JGI-2019a]|nr:hypothetical protein FRB93_010717 [Tulasnella sp. JGI-2019a]